MSEVKWKENKPQGYGEINETVNECTTNKEACTFPYCEKNLICKKDNTTDKEKTTVENKPEDDNVTAFFKCQEKLNTIEQEKQNILKHKEEAFNKVKIDIETIFIALECDVTDLDIQLTNKGIKISFSVKVFNGYETIPAVNTDLFTQLNKLLGVNGKLSLSGDTKIAGNHVRIINLIYEI